MAEDASLSSEASAHCRTQRDGVVENRELEFPPGALSRARRYHHGEGESEMSLAGLANDARQSDEASEQGDEADERLPELRSGTGRRRRPGARSLSPVLDGLWEVRR